MNSSRCESDPEPTPRRLQRRRSRSAPERVLSWLLVAILGLVVLSLVNPDRSRRAPPPRDAGEGAVRWAPRGGGSVDFLGEEQGFEVLRQFGGERFRIVVGDGTAFEAERLDRVVGSFLRDRLAPVRAGDRVSVRFWLGTVSTGMAPQTLREHALVWAMAFAEEEKGGESWFRASREAAREPLYARSLDELREKVLRELSREVVTFYGADARP